MSTEKFFVQIKDTKQVIFKRLSAQSQPSITIQAYLVSNKSKTT